MKNTGVILGMMALALLIFFGIAYFLAGGENSKPEDWGAIPDGRPDEREDNERDVPRNEPEGNGTETIETPEPQEPEVRTEGTEVQDSNTPPPEAIEQPVEQIEGTGPNEGLVFAHIEDENGQPIPGARLDIIMATNPAYFGDSDSNGDVRIPMVRRGTMLWQMRVTHPEYQMYWEYNKTVEAGVVNDWGTVTLKKGGALNGIVVDGEGKGVPGVIVSIEGGGVITRNTQRDLDKRKLVTDDEGRFNADGLQPGTYVMRVFDGKEGSGDDLGEPMTAFQFVHIDGINTREVVLTVKPLVEFTAHILFGGVGMRARTAFSIHTNVSGFTSSAQSTDARNIVSGVLEGEGLLKIEIPPGEHELVIQEAKLRFVIPEGVETFEQTFDLRTNGVRLQVIDFTTGALVPKQTIVTVRDPGMPREQDLWLSSLLDQRKIVLSSATGEITVPLSRGSYNLVVVVNGVGSWVVPVTVVADGIITQEHRIDGSLRSVVFNGKLNGLTAEFQPETYVTIQTMTTGIVIDSRCPNADGTFTMNNLNLNEHYVLQVHLPTGRRYRFDVHINPAMVNEQQSYRQEFELR
ncbi:MAG: carboxypeptidase regulatory-like domain-containing protein [Planctomycetes bacterium]|nr:carboxypeptidase regulatory-like domain-containing protein [Planctomycetota bacterium]